MSASVVLPPVLIDPTFCSRQFGAQIDPMGFFRRGLSLYLVLAYQITTGPGVKGQIGVYRSTDGGNTWTEQDAANHPPTGTRSGLSCCFDGSDKIYILQADNAGANLVVFTFSTASNTYTNTSANSPDVTGASFPALYVKSDGTCVIVTAEGAGSPLSYLTLSSSGVWSGPTG